MNMIGVQHARSIDDTIYERLLARNAFASVELAASHTATSHLYRLSSVLTKCLAAAYYGRKLVMVRKEMRDLVLEHYQILAAEHVSETLFIVPVQKK
ncbi:hypothetical protein [Labrenzia sp. OB1]|uniref:hypothetical protein n=1 Tax=Labrenzia sp. OB1 TaxID=1561204 RepID=UPI0012E78CDC|nr:hypothetical protein [Labrenzia sp. OB1]